jgi:hypothetical protein
LKNISCEVARLQASPGGGSRGDVAEHSGNLGVRDGLPSLAIAHAAFLGGGAEAVTLWALQSLQEQYKVSLITLLPIDLQKANERYGTRVDAAEVAVIPVLERNSITEKLYVHTAMFTLRQQILARAARKRRKNFDLLISKIVAFFSMQAFPWVLAYTKGLASIASFQALFQLVALANPLMLSFNGLIISTSARETNSASSPNGMTGASKQIRLAAIIFAVYFAGLVFGGRIAMNFLYGRSSPYLANLNLLPYFAIAYVLEAAWMLATAILGGFGETRATFVSQIAAMTVAVLFVIPWIVHSGLPAAVIGLIAVNGTRAAAGWFFVRYTAVKRASARVAVPA